MNYYQNFGQLELLKIYGYGSNPILLGDVKNSYIKCSGCGKTAVYCKRYYLKNFPACIYLQLFMKNTLCMPHKYNMI